jgi:acid stress chaperone HdeB
MKTWSIVLALSVSLGATAVLAQATLDVDKMTCKQVIFGQFAGPKSVAYWLSGYYNGRNNNTILDVASLNKNANKLATYCRSHYDVSVMDAAKNVLGTTK